jgi:hypothetical protein
MKTKMKPIFIGGGIGLVAGLGAAYLMKKNKMWFAVGGLAIGAVVAMMMAKKKEAASEIKPVTPAAK